MNISNMSREEILRWVGENREKMSDVEFDRFLARYEKDMNRRMEQIDRMEKKVSELYNEVSEFDDGVAQYFDIGSDKMLGTKIRVLTELKEGKSPGEIGKSYFDILEGFDKDGVPDGGFTEVGGWEYNPEKYK